MAASPIDEHRVSSPSLALPPPSATAPSSGGERPWLTPVLVGAGALAACALVAVRDPNQAGSYGYCPFKAATGLDCPGCGMMRGAHALFTGDVPAMFDHNIFLPVVMVAAVFGYVRWFRRSVGHEIRPLAYPPWALVVLSGVVLTFWLLRNLGGPFEYLASTLS